MNVGRNLLNAKPRIADPRQQGLAFGTAALAPGLYHYKVLAAGGVIGNGKLTIVR